MPQWCRVLISVVVAFAVTACGFTQLRTTQDAGPAPLPGTVVQNQSKVEQVISTSSTFTTAAIPASTVASTSQSAPMSNQHLDACKASRSVGIYIPAIELCRTVDVAERDSEGYLEPNPGNVSRDATTPLPGAGKFSLLTAHVTQNDGDHVFSELHKLAPGDKIITWANGSSHEFIVSATDTFAKPDEFDRLSAAQQTVTQNEIWLVTCEGEITEAGIHADNRFVRAVMVA